MYLYTDFFFEAVQCSFYWLKIITDIMVLLWQISVTSVPSHYLHFLGSSETKIRITNCKKLPCCYGVDSQETT